MSKVATSSKKTQDYVQLLSAIQTEVSQAQKDLIFRKALCYWNIGNHISKNILKNKSRAAYGGKLIKRLAHDTKIDVGTMNRLVKFAKEFEKPATWREFNWSSYKVLMGIKDSSARLQLIRKIKHKKLTTRQIEGEVKELKSQLDVVKPLSASLGTLYTYKLMNPAFISAAIGFKTVDCGFDTIRQVLCSDQIEKAPEDAIVKSQQSQDRFKLLPSGRSKEDLYTYRAYLGRVVDGDTVIFNVDVGFRTWIVERFRLRGIDTPELDTKKGERAKQYVEKTLKGASEIFIKSHLQDKYNRYLADIFIGPEHIYLNQKLIDSGHALRYA